MLTRPYMILAACAVAVGVAVVLVMRASSVSAVVEPTGSVARPAPARTGTIRPQLEPGAPSAAAWAEAASARVRAADAARSPEATEATEADATPSILPGPAEKAGRRGGGAIKPGPVGPASTKQSIARFEAKTGKSASKRDRLEIENAMKPAKAQDRVPGVTAARGKILDATCTAPNVHERYARLSGAERLALRDRCAKLGVTLAP